MKRKPWLGVDLDGTWADNSDPACSRYPFPPGKEIPETRAIIDHVIATGLLVLDGQICAEGIEEVKCFTARATDARSRNLAENWLVGVGMGDMEITSSKDFDMVWCLDDRAITMRPNTGLPLAIPNWDYSKFVQQHRNLKV